MTPRHHIPAALALAGALALVATVASAGKPVRYALRAGYDDALAVRSENQPPPAEPVFDYGGYDYDDGVDNDQQILSLAGWNYVFNLEATTAPRTVCFDFSALLSGATPPRGAVFCQTVRGGMVTVTGDNPTPMIDLQQGQETIRRFHMGWVEAGYQYHFAFGRDVNGDGVPETAPVRITCAGRGNTGCNLWTVEPQPDPADGFFKATLSREQITSTKGGGKYGPEEWIGTYSMPFALTLALK